MPARPWSSFFSAAVLIVAGSGCRQAHQAAAGPPPEVVVTAAVQRDIPISGEWVATLDGFLNAQIQSYVSGYVVRQNYREGGFVHKDDVLFEIDPRPFEAAVEQARGQLAQAHGQLAQAEGQMAQATAQLELTQINVKRDTPLAQARAIAQSQLDSELQAQKTAEAYIEQLTKSHAFAKPIVTQVAPLKAFYIAEAYHQNYAELHPDDLYIRINDAPKVANLKKEFPDLYSSKLAAHE